LIDDNKVNLSNYDGIVLAVAHNEFKKLEYKIKEVKEKKDNLVIYDIKGIFDKNLVDGRL
jgi:UDP-N-acetyl-D-galactosamine dehydrogenase